MHSFKKITVLIFVGWFSGSFDLVAMQRHVFFSPRERQDAQRKATQQKQYYLLVQRLTQETLQARAHSLKVAYIVRPYVQISPETQAQLDCFSYQLSSKDSMDQETQMISAHIYHYLLF